MIREATFVRKSKPSEEMTISPGSPPYLIKTMAVAGRFEIIENTRETQGLNDLGNPSFNSDSEIVFKVNYTATVSNRPKC